MKSIKKKSPLLLFSTFFAVVVAGVIMYVLFVPTKTSFKGNDVVDFNDFTIQISGIESKAIKLSEIDDFYKAVWHRTKKDISDCSNRPDVISQEVFAIESERENCERINNDIRRDLSSKKGIANYLKQNKRVDITYKLHSRSQNLNVDNIEVLLISGQENLPEKTFGYDFIYTNEVKNRMANIVDGGLLIKEQERYGLVWADIKKTTKDIVVWVNYNGQAKTIDISDSL